MKNTLSLFCLLIVTQYVNAQFTNDLLDQFSSTSCYVIAYHKETPISSATGFFISANANLYFVTNNHVVGAEFFINEYKRDNNQQSPPAQKIPDHLKVRIYNKEFGKFTFLNIPLSDNGKNRCIKFWENETQKIEMLDIVAIPTPELVTKLQSTRTLAESNILTELLLVPSSELFIVGFPLNHGQTALYPIWKRGTIASQPPLSNTNSSTFLIDATTRSGMSGSPVFFRNTSYTTNKDQNYGPLQTFLVGIYSAQNASMEIGVVSKLDAVFKKLNTL